MTPADFEAATPYRGVAITPRLAPRYRNVAKGIAGSLLFGTIALQQWDRPPTPLLVIAGVATRWRSATSGGECYAANAIARREAAGG